MKPIALAFLLAAIPVLAVAQQGNPGAHFIENWDLNEDGQVTLDEATERRGNVFLSFDANEDGFLDATEYVLFDEARANDMAEHGGQQGHSGKGMMNAANGMRLEVNDMDGDGKVSREEFLGQTGAWIARMDRNEDGVVTPDDIGRGKGHGQGMGQGRNANKPGN